MEQCKKVRINELGPNISTWINLNAMMSENTNDRIVNNFIFILMLIVFIYNKATLKGKKIIDSKFRINITMEGRRKLISGRAEAPIIFGNIYSLLWI